MSTNKYDIASAMNGIISDPVNQSIFSRPQPLTKTAAKKDDTADKAKAEKEKAKEKAAKEKEKERAAKEKAKEQAAKAKAKKKASTKYEACVIGLCKISEMLDEAGLSKSSSYALLALNDLISTAAKKKEEKEEKAKGKKDEKGKGKKEEPKDEKAKGKKAPPFMKKDEKGDKDKKVKKADYGVKHELTPGYVNPWNDKSTKSFPGDPMNFSLAPEKPAAALKSITHTDSAFRPGDPLNQNGDYVASADDCEYADDEEVSNCDDFDTLSNQIDPDSLWETEVTADEEKTSLQKLAEELEATKSFLAAK
jgi:hypothetical protein